MSSEICIRDRAGNTVRDMVKVLKYQMENKTGAKTESQDVIMQWLVRWAAMAYSRFWKGRRTPHERTKGRTCKTEVVPLGETVLVNRLRNPSLIHI